ncbi:MAG TPA: DUF1361 domain-containing protein [Candidatus Saccharimonadales bacterium]|nr:DUF1361 domain-containing protein [Candidatus Saccharimonadales bacterium]
MWLRSEAARRYVEAVGLVSLLCLAMLGFRAQTTGSTRYWFIPENLVLAWAGLAFGWILVNRLKVGRWLSWQNIVLSAIWLFFLPNTWYVLTDFLHVYATGEISELYDIAMIGTLVITGFALGFTSLYLVHKELDKRLSPIESWSVVEAVILLASFGIYLGRVLRWNSWDLVTNTSGLIINVSDRVADPTGNPHAFTMTGLFFVTLSVIYFAIHRAGLALRR